MDVKKWPAAQVALRKVAELTPYARNSRTHSDAQVAQLAASIKEWGWTIPVLVDEAGGLIAGHGRILAAQRLGLEEVPAMTAKGWSEAKKRAYVIADNKLALNAGWDEELLRLELQELGELGVELDLLGFDDWDISELVGGGCDNKESDKYKDGREGGLSADFGCPPFSILDTRKGDWIDRRKQWQLKIGDNGESREGTLGVGLLEDINSVSILDAAMAEILVKWFGKVGGVAFDPFAGDTVFGFVSASLGMHFVGIELRQEQATINQERCDKHGLSARYICDTSEKMDEYVANDSVDFVFSCPPYADLEVYSDDPRDLSNMSHDNFFLIYRKILQNTYAKLKNNRFAVIVMGDVRGKDGGYIGTVNQTITIMLEAGFKLYNELILINSHGTLPIRAGAAMRKSRKVGKTHQNILVFLKGDGKAAAEDLGEIVFQDEEEYAGANV